MNDIVQLRQQIRALQAEREALAQVRCNREEAAAVVKAYVKQAHADGQALLQRMVGSLASGGYVDDSALAVGGPQSTAYHLAPLLVVMVGHKAFADSLLAEVAETVPDGPDASARKARLAAIGVELDRLEIEEESIVEASEGTAVPIERRPDARPEIVIGLRK